MEAIGGYFSLELPLQEKYHKNAIQLNTGRNCLEYILLVRGYKKVYLPFYTCEAVMEPINKLGISYEFYHIDINFEIKDRYTLKEGEALLYTNYFGLKQRYVEQLAEKIGSRLIVDNTQAFYAQPLEDIDTFYTCRKFFGVPDGAYLYTNKVLDIELKRDVSFDRMTHLLKRIDFSAEDGYKDYQTAEHLLSQKGIMKMSRLTERLMQSIDYQAAAKQRIANFTQLHEALKTTNQLNFDLDENAVPMVYPYLTKKKGLRERLIENKVFVAKYWPNVQKLSNYELEYEFATRIIPLPCDQRYGEEEMNRIVDIVSTQYNTLL